MVKTTPELKFKRAALLVFGLSLFLLPGQNWYLSTGFYYQPPKVQAKEIISPPVAAYPTRTKPGKVPGLTAKAAVAIDIDSGVIIYQENENQRLLPASTVKIMTALVALESFPVDQVITVSEIEPNGQKMKLLNGEKISVKNLLYGLLLASANDAAEILAKSFPGGEEAFMAAVNKKATQLYLTNSYFANPTGLDSDLHGNPLPRRSFTTAKELARLAAVAIKNEIFKEIVATAQIEVADTSGTINHSLTNINQLLGKIEGVEGIKTGWTEEAGECLVSFTQKEGRRIVTVVLGSRDRFADTTTLIDWLFGHYSWVGLAPSI